MKKIIAIPIFSLLLSSFTLAQPDFEKLQNDWIQKLQTGESVADLYWEGKNFSYIIIDSTDTGNFMQFIKNNPVSGVEKYKHEQVFRHDDNRFVSVGNLKTDTSDILLLTGWRNVDGNWKKEIDVILAQKLSDLQVPGKILAGIDSERKKWVQLANQHNPKAHIAESYTENASYFASGRKSTGREEITERYVYMKNPNYQVDLEKERLWGISDDNLLELGRYFTGTEHVGDGGIYVILWERQNPGYWQIALDFNF